jgi:DNA-binding transcriptional ArsR family regulator
MARNKKSEFDENLLEIVDFAKALSHPARLAILNELAEKNTCICGEIVDIMPLAQSTVSQHLKELQKAGLICGEIDGPKSCYCINKNTLTQMANKISDLLKALCSNNCCGVKK